MCQLKVVVKITSGVFLDKNLAYTLGNTFSLCNEMRRVLCVSKDLQYVHYPDQPRRCIHMVMDFESHARTSLRCLV